MPAMGADAAALLNDPAVSALPAGEALEQLADRLRRALRAEAVAVFEWPGGRRVEPVAVASAAVSRKGGGPGRLLGIAEQVVGERTATTGPIRPATVAPLPPEGVSVETTVERTPAGDTAVVALLHVDGTPAGVMVVVGGRGGDHGTVPDLVRVAGERTALVLALRRLERAERRHRLSGEHARRHLALLVRAGDALAGALTDIRPALEALGAVVVPMFADWFAVDLLPDGPADVADAGGQRVRVVADGTPPASGHQAAAGANAATGGGPPPHRHPDGDRLVASVLAGGRAEMVVRRPPAGGDHLPGPEHGHSQPAGGAESMLVVPVRVRGTLVGAASFVTGAERRGYRMSDLRVAEDLAERIGVTVERVRLWHARQRAATAAEANERRLHAVVDASPLAIVELDAAGTPVWWNPAAQDLLAWVAPTPGDGPVPGSPASEAAAVLGASDPEAAAAVRLGPLEPMWARACRGEAMRGEVVQSTRLDGTPAHLSVWSAPLRSADGEPTGALAMIEDVTERQRLMDRFHQAERLQAMARLAGSVAHDFNNLLTVVLGSCALLLDRMGPDDPLVEEVRAIRSAGQRAADLTSQLLSIGHRRPLQPAEVEPDTVLANMRGVLSRVVGDDVMVEHVSFGPPARILVEAAELERAVLNLALNARDAMPDGGRLTLGTRTRRAGGPAPGGVLVDIWVADTGTGMDAHTAEHCFEPFFTTKPRGSGTGLGLAGVHASVTQAGGSVSVETRPGAGTTFTLTFPAVEEDVLADGEEAPDAEDEPVVLVVDDDPDVRRLVVQALLLEGFLVVAAADAAEALQAVDGATTQLTLLVTDVSMPGMDGRELAARLLAASPRLPVLYMTGDQAAARLPAGVDVLTKPFTPDELVQRARRAMERRQV